MSERTYQVQNSRVYGNGQSYNLHNKVTAEKLCNTLNGYEIKIEQLQELMNIENQLKILTMDLAIIKHDLDNVKEQLEAIQ